MVLRVFVILLASLCETGSLGTGRWRLRQRGSDGPAGPEGENLATNRNISVCRKVLSPTACGRSPLAEGAKRKTYPGEICER